MPIGCRSTARGEYADFARVQCAIAAIEAAGTAAPRHVWDSASGEMRTVDGPDRARLAELRAREAELFTRIDVAAVFAPAIVAFGSGGRTAPALTRHGLIPWVRADCAGAEFVWLGLARGLVGAVQCVPGEWVRCADALLAACPVTGVELRGALPWRVDEDDVWLEGDPSGI